MCGAVDALGSRVPVTLVESRVGLVGDASEISVSHSRDKDPKTEVEAFFGDASESGGDPWERTFTDRLRELLADDASAGRDPAARSSASGGNDLANADAEPGLSGLGDEWFEEQPMPTGPDHRSPFDAASEGPVGPWDDLASEFGAPPVRPDTHVESAVPHGATTSGLRERPTADVPVVMGSAAVEIAAIAQQMLEHIGVADRCVLAVDGGALVVDAAPGSVQSGRWRAREPGGKTWTAPTLEALVARALGVEPADANATDRIRNL